ncbi:BTAD domain-containing putative transcriptional regulator [Pseudonocardia aurantiaca]|uniref:ATP-binding protein n=1 Tax=Pseudonocardia aurantiaca TaxID=75290 RepID=A0ABW4FCJ7_9PSEU
MAGPAGEFGAALRRRRTEALLTQEQLAERTGLSVRTIRDLERGRVRYPRPGSVRLLADVLALAGAELGEFEALGRQHYWTERVAEVRKAAVDGHPSGADPVPADRPVPAQLPADVAGFTGRSDVMAEMDALLADSDAGAVSITVLAGAPGVGKSALAVHWAHRVRHRFPDGQLYLNLMGHAAAPPLSPAEALTRLLRSLDVAPDRVPTDAAEAAALFRSLLADTRTLVVLDDARQADQVRPLLPGGPGCHVLVTSRVALPGLVARDGARRLTLSALDPVDSRALLVRLLGSERAAGESAAVDELARLCGHLPLALRIAAANVLGSSGLPAGRVEAFVERLRSGNRLAELAVPADADAMVRGAFDLSYAALPAAARELFRVLSVVPGGDVTPTTAAAMLDVPADDGRRLLEQLAGAHLVEQPVPGRYAQPDLLRLYAAEQLASDPAGREAPWDRLLRHYLDVLDAASLLLHPEALRLPRDGAPGEGSLRFADQREAAAWIDAELPALQAVVLRSADRGQPAAAWKLVDALGAYFQLRGPVLPWHTMAANALAAAEVAGDDTAQAMAHLSISAAFLRQDRYADGIRHGERALERATAAGWLDGEVGALRALGNLLRLSGRPDEATDHLERALAVADRADLPSRASIIANMAVVNHEQGRLGAAALHFTHALELLSPATSRAAQVRTDLGDVLNGLGKPEEALGHLQAALVVHQELGDRGQVSYNLRCQAEVHRDAGRWVQAHELADAATAIAREIDDQRLLAQAQETTASVHLAAQRYGQALVLFDTALAAATRMTNRYGQSQILAGIAAAHLGRQDAVPALAAAEASLDIARRGGYLFLEGQALAAAAGAELLLERPEVALEHARAAVAAHDRSGYVRGQVIAARVLDLAVTRSRVGS